MDTAITIEVLPASYGDCVLVSCPIPDRTWHLLVDTGPDETWPVLRDRLAKLPVDTNGERFIDLAIVSHIDHDHIGAARLLFGDKTLALSYGDIWFNGRHHLERGVAEGEALSALLGTSGSLPWNKAFYGAPASTPGDGAFVELQTGPGQPRLTLLSPTPRRLAQLAPVWDAELLKLRRRESNSEPEGERAGELSDLESLAAIKSAKDRSPTNGSSIAILLEHQGASALLAADAFATVLGSALLGLAAKRGLTPPLHVDAFKLSHHGSRANLIVELLRAVQSDYYIVSTDNSRFGHPNDETLARVVLYGGQKPAICFNYSTDSNLRWARCELQHKHNFRTRFPSDKGGLVLDLPARN